MKKFNPKKYTIEQIENKIKKTLSENINNPKIQQMFKNKSGTTGMGEILLRQMFTKYKIPCKNGDLTIKYRKGKGNSEVKIDNKAVIVDKFGYLHNFNYSGETARQIETLWKKVTKKINIPTGDINPKPMREFYGFNIKIFKQFEKEVNKVLQKSKTLHSYFVMDGNKNFTGNFYFHNSSMTLKLENRTLNKCKFKIHINPTNPQMSVTPMTKQTKSKKTNEKWPLIKIFTNISKHSSMYSLKLDKKLCSAIRRNYITNSHVRECVNSYGLLAPKVDTNIEKVYTSSHKSKTKWKDHHYVELVKQCDTWEEFYTNHRNAYTSMTKQYGADSKYEFSRYLGRN